jgi:alanine racemase
VVDRPTSATIHLSAIRANFALARKQSAGREPIAVIKADAYGHGAAQVACALAEAGCSRFAVATVPEAETLRDSGVRAPILVLGGVWGGEEARVAVARGLVPVIHHLEHLEWLVAAATNRASPLPVQVEIDTGMRRMGVAAKHAAELLAAVAAQPALVLEGVYTHFARADEVDLGPSLDQLKSFQRIVGASGVRLDCIHAANSAGILAGEPIWNAMPEQTATRPGLMLYGVPPAPHLDANLRAAMTLKTHVVALRAVGAGESVGYSAEFRAAADTQIATLAIGYEDGVPISSGGRGAVIIRSTRLPIVGRVSMDYIGVDVGTARVEIGDEAILFSGPAASDAADSISVVQAAHAANTIAYELLVRVGQRVVRHYCE